jgi:integrase
MKRKVAVLLNQDQKWCIDFTDEYSKRRRQVVGDGTSEKAARDAARIKARELNLKIETERNPETASVETVLRAYFEGDKAFESVGVCNRVGPLTASKYRTIAKHLKEILSEQVAVFAELTPYHIEMYLTKRKVAGAAPKTILAEFILLRSLIRWAAEEYEDRGVHFFLKYDVTKRIKPPKLPPRLPVYFETAELAALFAAAASDPQIRAMVCLGYYHGLRTSSLAVLKVADVTLTPDGGKFKVWKKAGGEIEFELHPDAAEAMRACPPVAGSIYWFGDEWASNHGQLSQHLCGFIRRATGVGKRFHDLRHTMAHAHVVAGTPAPMIQQAMGHSNLNTTQQYVRLWQHEVANVAARLGTVGK